MTHLQTDPHDEPKSGLEHSKSIATALRGTARRLRFSTSNRSSLYKAVGLRPSPLTQWFRGLFVIITLMVLVVPNVIAITYFGFIASDQYQSESRFTVRTSTPALGKDQFAKVTGIPSAKIVQDTQIVTNFLVSQNMLDRLEQKMGLRSIYTSVKVDYFSRLASDAPREKFLSYWKKKVTSAISVPSGIVTIKLRAFSADDAQSTLQAAVTELEQVINDMNDRIWRDVTQVAQSNLENASKRLKDAREKVQMAQQRSGVFTVESSANSIFNLVTKLEAERIALRQRYEVNLQSIARDTPQMRILKREIESKDDQILALRAQMTGHQGGSQEPLAQTASSFSQLQLEQNLAEQQFSASVKTLEQVQFSSRQQLMYLDAFIPPTHPQEAEYPRRMLWISVTFIASLITWAAMMGGLATLHKRLD